MLYFVFFLVALLSCFAVLVVSSRFGATDIGRLYRPFDGVEPFKGKKLITLIIVLIAVLFAVQISLYRNVEIINLVKLYGLLLIVCSAALIDARRRIIPNALIITGLVFRALLYVWEYFSRLDIGQIVVNDLIGFALGFVFLAIVSLLTKGSLGFGDVKLFGVIGICTGIFCTYSTLFASLIISTVVSLIGILTKKMSKRDSFPFGPCVAIGYVIALLLTSY